MVKIVKAEAADFDAFYDLFAKTLHEGYFRYPNPAESAQYILRESFQEKKLFQKDVVEGRRPLYIAYEEDAVVGYLLTGKAYGGVMFGHYLGVNAVHQKKGIGTKLLATWEEDTLKDNVHTIYLWTTENNIAFYKKRGFTLGGTFPKGWFGIDYYLFYKNLGEPDSKMWK